MSGWPCRRRLLYTATILLFAALQAAAADFPQPPCGTAEPFPAFPATGTPPTIRAWKSSELGPNWKPPACTGWGPSTSPTVVALAARFQFAGGLDGLRRRIGAISETKGMMYWSTTDKQWQKLILGAYALPRLDSTQPRADFALDEISEGKTLFAEQEDNLFGKVIYRMHIRALAPGHMVIEVENATTIKYLLIPIFDSGQAQSIYYMDQESANVWRYYALVRTSGTAASLLGGHEASAINRAVAFYRHLAGIPTDQEPPAAR
jgi:hypothetical protein